MENAWLVVTKKDNDHRLSVLRLDRMVELWYPAEYLNNTVDRWSRVSFGVINDIPGTQRGWSYQATLKFYFVRPPGRSPATLTWD